jgi:hypothetical protein
MCARVWFEFFVLILVEGEQMIRPCLVHTSRKVMKIQIAIALTLVATSALCTEYQPLEGTYKIGGKTIFDPPTDEPQNTHFYLDFEGATARDLYQAIPAKPERGICGAKNDLTKRSGNVQCTQVDGGKEYHCAFGVELLTRKIVPGVIC